ncbi:MAG: hypothetical protein Q7R94_00020, partial [bacterium]|nr:hypothetical protein [bacterium]
TGVANSPAEFAHLLLGVKIRLFGGTKLLTPPKAPQNRKSPPWDIFTPVGFRKKTTADITAVETGRTLLI